MKRTLLGLALLVAMTGRSWADDTCNGFINIDYVGTPPLNNIGDTVDVKITFGTGNIQSGTKLTITSFQHNLDCNSNFALTPPCHDEGAIIAYEGDASIDDPTVNANPCPGVTWTTNVPGGGFAINQVIFTASPALDIPANVPTCRGSARSRSG